MIFRSTPLVLMLSLAVPLIAIAQSADDLPGGVSSGSPHKASVFPLKPEVDQAQAAQLSANLLTRYHYDPQPLNDAMSAKIFKAYFDELDPEKMFFTQADMAKFEPLKTKLDDAIWDQDLSGPFAIFNVYEQHAVERMSYARKLLTQGFDFNTQENYNFDRKKADWPKDQAEWDQLWRERTMNDWLRLKLAGKSDDEIRKTLDKRYANYVERVQQMDAADAFQIFMDGYAHSTDPHTDYFTPRTAENFDIQMKLSLEGIGAQLQSRDDYTTIFSLIPRGPADLSGKLKSGDRIVAVGQGDSGPMVDVVGWRIDDVTKLIRGKKDTTVRLEILPADVGPDGKHVLVTLVRKTVTLEDQAAKKKIIDIDQGGTVHKVGVIDLPSFYADFGARSGGDAQYKSATRDVAKLIDELKAAGVEGIVMDLRNNGGGSLAEANEMTGLFIDKGPVVQVRDPRGHVAVQGDDDAGMAWSGPLAVMVNRGSASASEIFAAAIQDYGRGVIIGEPTFGKGTVQTLVDLDRYANGGSEKPKYGELKMTIQEFFRINGGSTQLKGVTPDIAFPKNGDEKDFGEETYDNHLPWTQIPPADYKPVADPKSYLGQLQALHDKRVATSPAWKLMLDELAQYKLMRAKTTISLNYAQRESERKQQESLQTAFRTRHKAIDGTGVDTDEPIADDGLDAGERSISSELKQQDDAKKAKDVELNEVAHILDDEVHLIASNPQLAAQALPYGGKNPDADATSPAAPSSVPAPADSSSDRDSSP